MYSIKPLTTKRIEIDETPILTPTEVGLWLNLPAGIITKNTALIEGLIKTVTDVVQNYTWLRLQRTVFEANFSLDNCHWNYFLSGNLKLMLERSPIIALSDITKIEYLDETTGTYIGFDRGATTSSGLYENTTEKEEQRGWASVYFKENVPYDNRYNAYKIKVTFTAGFTIDTDPVTDIPPALKTAMLQIIASYYTNRGDCAERGCSMNGYKVPCEAKGIIDQYSIARTVLC
jgi:hypothetical protein